MNKMLAALAGLSMTLGVSTASAAVLIEFKQVGSDIVGTATGSLNLTGVSAPNTQNNNARLNVNRGEAFLGAYGSAPAHLVATRGYSITPATTFAGRPFWGGANDNSYWPEAGDATGSQIGIVLYGNSANYRNRVFVRNGYASNETIQSTALYKNLSFAVLGVTAGSSFDYYLAGSGAANQEGRRVTVSFAEVTAIPLPATALLLLGGLAGLAGLPLARRRRAA